jgi:hypothetical protein
MPRATKSKGPGRAGFAADRELISLAKTLSLTAIEFDSHRKKDRPPTGSNPQAG